MPLQDMTYIQGVDTRVSELFASEVIFGDPNGIRLEFHA